MSWLQELFGVTKPIIGMCHLQPLPGDPSYDTAAGMASVVAMAAREIAALQEGGVDGILISNEFSLPYLTKTEPITAAAMARVVGELRSDLGIPFGINVLWDGRASLDVAVATGASFVREVFSGVYASDFGLWDTNVGALARHRRAIDGQHVRMLFNILPEAARYLGGRDLASIARSTVFNAAPDGVCVSGLTAGAEVDIDALRTVRAAAGETPVVVNTGVTDANVAELLGIGDAAIVGTFLKRDGRFENAADPARIKVLMEAAHPAREVAGA
jgi:uncharacterized protein